MLTGALEALVGTQPSDEVLAGALSTIPAAELPAALDTFARSQGAAAVPLLSRCLGARPGWAGAAATALGRLAVPAAAEALLAAEARATDKAVRTAIRRALYRLRQAGAAPPPRPGSGSPLRSGFPRAPRGPAVTQAWTSPVDGTGSSGLWLVVEGPLGERTLLSALVSDVAGVLDFAAGPIAKKHLDREVARLQAEQPWVPLPPGPAWARLVEAQALTRERGGPERGDLSRWLTRVAPPAAPPGRGPVEPEGPADPTLLERGADLLALPELQTWFLDPEPLHAAALERLQAQESRLVVTPEIKAERLAALTDRVADAELAGPARALWSRRLEALAWVLEQTGRDEAARPARATAQALADPERPARHLPFVRALVEKSLEVAGEVALGRLPADDASRRPRAPGSGPTGGARPRPP